MPTSEMTGTSVNSDTKQIDDTDNPYTTSGESIILVDTTNGAVTVTLSTADATATSPENKITIIDSGTNASSNNITINTQGAETIDGSSSFTITTDRGQTTVQSDGSDWTTNSNIEGVGVSDGENFDGQGTSDFSDLNSVWASSVNADPTKINDTDSPHTTSGESIIQVDTSSGAVTVTLSTSDATATSPENKLTIVDTGLNAASNNITINTEGGEVINPGGNSSITITLNGGWVSVWSDGSDWFSTRGVEAQEVSTDQASIGTVTDQGDVFRLTDRRTPSSGQSEIQFTGLGIDTEYRIFYNTQITDANDLVLRLNDDGSSTGNYDYWDASGTLQTGQNSVLLANTSDSVPLAGVITVTQLRFSNADRVGINHRFLFGNPGRISDFAREAVRDVGESLTSVELIGSLSGGTTLVELWERDYS